MVGAGVRVFMAQLKQVPEKKPLPTLAQGCRPKQGDKDPVSSWAFIRGRAVLSE